MSCAPAQNTQTTVPNRVYGLEAMVGKELQKCIATFKDILDHQLILQWAKGFSDANLHAVSLSNGDARLLEIRNVRQRLNTLEGQVSLYLDKLGILDPRYQHQVTVDAARLVGEVSRVRRMVDKADRLIRNKRYKLFFVERKLLWQLIWDFHENKNADPQRILSMRPVLMP